MGYPVFFQKKAKLRHPDAFCYPPSDDDMETLRFSRVSCCHEHFKNAKKRRERDLEIPWNGSRKPKCSSKCGGPTMQVYASGGHHPESSSAYLIWPPSARHNGSAEERAAYFGGLQKAAELERDQRMPGGHQATTLLDLMTIRAFHTKALRRYSLGTALGFRTRGGVLTNIPAIIVFVGRKVHKEWLLDVQRLPSALEGPGGVWCDVDVVEFSYYGSAAAAPKEHLYTELVEGLRGNDPFIGAGSQVASQETYGTLGGVVRSQTSGNQLGFLTNRHVAVDLDYPNQKMFHPLPPSLGPGVYLGAVERATSFITDDLWYGVFAGMNPETFVRADGAFIPFTETFDLNKVTANLKGVGEMGDVMRADLQAPIESVIGKHVLKVGRSSGLTKGLIMAYAVEYNDERGVCYFTDFLVVGENGQPFDLEGDSGSLILLTGEEYDKPRPFGIIWGGTANRGRLKLRSGHGPENWTSGVDLGRLLDLLQLELITSNSRLAAAIEEHRNHQLRLQRAEGGFHLTGFRDVRISEESATIDEHGRLQYRVERVEGGASLDEKSVEEEEPYETAETETLDVVQQLESLEQPAAPPGDRERLRFDRPESEDSGDEDFNLSLGATTHSLPLLSQLEVKGIIEDDVRLGLGVVEDRGPKRRRFP